MEECNDTTWQEYLAKIKDIPHQDIVARAVNLLPGSNAPLSVIDTGCGDGRNSQYLVDKGLDVHAFDQDVNMVNLSRMRFQQHANFAICLSDIDHYIFPPNELVLAFSSLFYSSPHRFELNWHNLIVSIRAEGLFCGRFLGRNDTYANLHSDQALLLGEQEIQRLFSFFDILEWHEEVNLIKDVKEGVTHHHTHTHTLLARKCY